jgi:hypothetical protein
MLLLTEKTKELPVTGSEGTKALVVKAAT